MGGSNRAVAADFGNFRRPTAPGVKREAEEDWSRWRAVIPVGTVR